MLAVGDDVPDMGTTMTHVAKNKACGMGGLWEITWLVV